MHYKGIFNALIMPFNALYDTFLSFIIIII